MTRSTRSSCETRSAPGHIARVRFSPCCFQALCATLNLQEVQPSLDTWALHLNELVSPKIFGHPSDHRSKSLRCPSFLEQTRLTTPAPLPPGPPHPPLRVKVRTPKSTKKLLRSLPFLRVIRLQPRHACVGHQGLMYFWATLGDHKCIYQYLRIPPSKLMDKRLASAAVWY